MQCRQTAALLPIQRHTKSANKHPPAKPVVFHFRAVSPNTTSGAQAALMTTWQSCDCYLPPVNGPFLCLTFFSYAFAPLFCSLFLFSRLLFYPCFFFFFCLISYCLFFCSFLFIGKASLEPADYPRVFLYKKARGAFRAPSRRLKLPAGLVRSVARDNDCSPKAQSAVSRKRKPSAEQRCARARHVISAIRAVAKAKPPN